jgi:hypothetical protein
MTNVDGQPHLALVRAPQFSRKSYGWTVGIIAGFCLLFFGAAFLSDSEIVNRSGTAGAVGIAVLAAAMSGLLYGSIFYFPVLLIRKSMFNSERVEKINQSSEELQGALEQDFVTNLVRINFKYIDAYYLQTRIQADKSFFVTVAAAAVSLMLIVAGIIMMFFGTLAATPAVDSGSVTAALGTPATAAATLSAAAGILGQFISAVFFYLYNQTVAKMADYHRKLVFTQNIGLALKISDGLPPEEKTKAQLALIETLSTDINQFLSK